MLANLSNCKQSLENASKHTCTQTNASKRFHGPQTLPYIPTHTQTCPHTPIHAHICPHTPTHAQALFKKNLRLFMALLTIFPQRHFRRLLMALLTIFNGFLDDFLQLFLFCFLCSTYFVSTVQKSDYLFKGGCKSLS